MAGEELPSQHAGKSSAVELITVLGPNDVLLGRGSGTSNYMETGVFVLLSKGERTTTLPWFNTNQRRGSPERFSLIFITWVEDF